MNRQSSRPGLGTLTSVAVVATALAAACNPSNNVPPGAPVLTEAFIIENGSTPTQITPATSDCAPAVADGTHCEPTADTLCRYTAGSNWCRCVMNMMTTPPPPPPPVDASVDADVDGGVADGGDVDGSAPVAEAGTDVAPPPPPGTWNCGPFAPNSGVLYVFDRLLDTAPLGTGLNAGVTGVANLTAAPAPANAVVSITDYASNGTANEVIFPLLGTLRVDGPSLFVKGQAVGASLDTYPGSPWLSGLPGGSTVTISLDNTKVLAKDGTTSFVSSGLLQDSTITFMTGPFNVSLTVPTPAAPADPDAGPGPTTVPPDMTPVVAAFSAMIDPAQIALHLKVTAAPAAGGAAVTIPVEAISMDGLNVNIQAVDASATPDAGTMPTVVNWPADSVITVVLDATTPDAAGDTLGAASLGSFTTSAM